MRWSWPPTPTSPSTTSSPLILTTCSSHITTVRPMTLFLGFGPADGPNQTPSVFPSPGENLEQAIECAKTFLLFHPDDGVMKDNLAYYSVMLGEDKAEAISPRQVPWAHLTFPLHAGSGRTSSGLLRGCRPRAAAPLGGSVFSPFLVVMSQKGPAII